MEASNTNVQIKKYTVGPNVPVVEIRDGKKFNSRYEIMSGYYYVDSDKGGFWYTTEDYRMGAPVKELTSDFQIGYSHFPFGGKCNVNGDNAFFITQLGNENEGDIGRFSYHWKTNKTVKLDKVYFSRGHQDRHKDLDGLRKLHKEFEYHEKQTVKQESNDQQSSQASNYAAPARASGVTLSVNKTASSIDDKDLQSTVSAIVGDFYLTKRGNEVVVTGLSGCMGSLARILQMNIISSRNNPEGQFLHFRFGDKVSKEAEEFFITGGCNFKQLKDIMELKEHSSKLKMFKMLIVAVMKTNIGAEEIAKNNGFSLHDAAVEELSKSRELARANGTAQRDARVRERLSTCREETMNNLGVFYTRGGKRIEYLFYLEYEKENCLRINVIFANKSDCQKSEDKRYFGHRIKIVKDGREFDFEYELLGRKHSFSLCEAQRFYISSDNRVIFSGYPVKVDMMKHKAVYLDCPVMVKLTGDTLRELGKKIEEHPMNFVISGFNERELPIVAPKYASPDHRTTVVQVKTCCLANRSKN